MKLHGARIRIVSAPLPTPIRNARHVWTERAGALLQVEDSEGHVGVGEASPLPEYSPDTLDDCARALSAVDWAALPPLDLERGPLEAVKGVVGLIDARLPAARFAVETALLDLIGRATRRSLPKLLGVARAAPVPLCALLPATDVAADVAEIARLRAEGYRTFKRKLRGGDLAAELDRVAALCADAGADFRLRLDANRSIPPDALGRALARLATSPVEWLEEPTAESAAWPRRSPVPLAADESLREGGAAGATVLVLKPMMLGGIAPCLALARAGHAAGFRAVASHLFDGPVALAAASALALALPEHAAASGLAPHAGLSAWGCAPLPFLREGQVLPWDAPGHGIEVPT